SRRGAHEGRLAHRDFGSATDQGRLRRESGLRRPGFFQSRAAPERRQGLYQLAVVERGARGLRQDQRLHQRAPGCAHRSLAVASADTGLDQDLYATSDRYQRRSQCIIQRSFRPLTRIIGAPVFLGVKNLFAVVAVGALAPAVMAQTSQSWDQILAAAKKEAVVSVIGPQGNESRDALTLAFQKKYPDIRVELQSPAGPQIGPKLPNELAAGRNGTDVLITGTTTALEALLPANALVPVKSWLSGPNTQDASKWRGGKLKFSDEAQSY